MEKVLKLYTYIDGVNDTPFPSESLQVLVADFRCDYKRMGGAPTISCSVMHPNCLDKLWTYNVYALFNGERFFIKQIPTSSYDNTDFRYKHELELVSERIILDNVYFYDVVDSEADFDKPVSNSSSFTFFGDIHEFAKRLNESLDYSKVGYSVVVDDGISSEAKLLSFQDQFFTNVLQEIYNTYEIPYYFTGKVIHIGFTDNAITTVFRYGQDESLLSIQKQNANYKIVNRVTGVGSEDNIPYYYPNDYESKDEVEANGGTWIQPQKNLMPSIYRESLGKVRFYEALDNTYTIPNSDEYYKFENPYIDGKPKEHIVNFEDIKPTIKGITNAEGLRIDMFSEFAFDANDNDEFDEEGNYLHPYFFGKLRRFDGEYGFNLFDHAIDESEMTISMTSGSCGSCEFIIGVEEETQKNIVQVDENGNLLRDSNGNVIRSGSPQEKQNDTKNNEVWIALKKDQDTFGVLMPNAKNNYKPKAGDTFVILHIDLPKAYILAAEDKLKEELIKYMSLNNSEKFNFSISFSRIFFAENPDILKELNENARIQIEYNNERYELYVSSYSYSMSKDIPLPEIRIELSDTLTISQNALQNEISEVKNDILSTFGASQDFLKHGLRYFLRKDKDDRSRGKIASDKGFEVGKDKGIFKDSITSIVTAVIDKLKNVYHIESPEFQMGELGNGYVLKYENGKSYFEVDEMLVRRIAYFVELIIKQLQYVGGEIALTPASMKCTRVEEYEEYYRCYFEKERDGQSIKQEFRVGDQARAQSFNIEEGANANASNQYYWRLVVRAESDENFIDLSKIDCDTGSLPPRVGDEIVQLGNRNDVSRQNAIILSTIGDDTPSIKQYEGINSYSLEGKDVTVISPKGNKLKGDFLSKTGQDLVGRLDDLGASLDNVINQTDKVYTIWFYDYNPSSSNYPTNEWIDEAAKQEHVEDIFYNQEAGMAWRYQEVSEGVYAWAVITDHETIKALENAAKAQATADKKMQNFVTQPVPPYSVGDRWSNAVYGTQYDNDELVCIKGKAAGESFSINDWQLVSSMSSEDKKHFYSEFQRTDTAIQTLVADGKTKDEAIAAANAAAKAASDAASAAAQTANAANETANTTASALIQTNKSISSIVVAFERNADGSLKLDANGSPRITSAAGSVITNEMAGIYATKTTVDGINGRLVTAESNISATSKSLTALSQKITFDSSGNITNINKSGLVAESNFASLFSTQVTSQGVAKTSQLTAYVAKTELGDLVSKIAISADQIDLTGKVTFSDFNQSLQSTINGKATSSDIDSKITAYDKTLGSLAKLSAVEKAQLGSTIISGGYIKTELIDVEHLTTRTFEATKSGHTYSLNANGFRITKSDGSKILELYASDNVTYLNMVGSLQSLHITPYEVSFGKDGLTQVMMTKQGLSLGNQAKILGFAVGNTATSQSGVNDRTDFILLNSDTTIELPDASTCVGKVIFVKKMGSNSKLIVKNVYVYNSNSVTSSKSDFGNGSRLFISNGVAWYEFSCN